MRVLQSVNTEKYNLRKSIIIIRHLEFLRFFQFIIN